MQRLSRLIKAAAVCSHLWTHEPKIDKSAVSYLQTHVIWEEGEEVMLHVAVDERVSKHPVQQDVAGQVQDAVGHLVDPLRSPGRGEHVEADVLRITHISTIVLLRMQNKICCRNRFPPQLTDCLMSVSSAEETHTAKCNNCCHWSSGVCTVKNSALRSFYFYLLLLLLLYLCVCCIYSAAAWMKSWLQWLYIRLVSLIHSNASNSLSMCS